MTRKVALSAMGGCCGCFEAWPRRFAGYGWLRFWQRRFEPNIRIHEYDRSEWRRLIYEARSLNLLRIDHVVLSECLAQGFSHQGFLGDGVTAG